MSKVKFKIKEFEKEDNVISKSGKFIIKDFKKNENYLTKREKFITFYREDDNVRNEWHYNNYFRRYK